MPSKRAVPTRYEKLKEMYLMVGKLDKSPEEQAILKDRIFAQLKHRKAEVTRQKLDSLDKSIRYSRKLAQVQKHMDDAIDSAKKKVLSRLMSSDLRGLTEIQESAVDNFYKKYPQFCNDLDRLYIKNKIIDFVEETVVSMSRQLNKKFGPYLQRKITNSEKQIASTTFSLFEEFFGSKHNAKLHKIIDDSTILSRFYSNPFYVIAKGAIDQLKKGDIKELKYFCDLWLHFFGRKPCSKNEIGRHIDYLKYKLGRGQTAGHYSELNGGAQGVQDSTNGQVLAHELVHQMYYTIGRKPSATHYESFIVEARTESLATLIYAYTLGKESEFRKRINVVVDLSHSDSNLSVTLLKSNKCNEYDIGYTTAVNFCESVGYNKEKIKRRIMQELQKLFDFKK